MAGHAPELNSTRERLAQWINEVSDYRLSAYMLVVASLVAMLLYLVESRVLA